jgi:hypothetical protein
MYPIDSANISDGTDNHVYALRKLGENKIFSLRAEAAAPSDQPATVTISHEESGAGDNTQYSSLLRFDRVVERADGVQGTVTFYGVLRYPPKIATSVQVGKTMTEFVSFLAVAGYKDKFIAREP